MKLKSRGLGRKELVMDFREYEIVVEGGDALIVGTIREPVTWDFSIRMCQDDLAGLIHIATRRNLILWLLRALFTRKRHAHWGDEPEAHVPEAKNRLAATRKRIAESDMSAWGAVRERTRPARPSGRPTAKPAGANSGGA